MVLGRFRTVFARYVIWRSVQFSLPRKLYPNTRHLRAFQCLFLSALFYRFLATHDVSSYRELRARRLDDGAASFTAQ